MQPGIRVGRPARPQADANPRRAPSASTARPAGAKDWYRDAVVYEVHVRAFSDSNGDGTGDFRGLTAKLDYLRDLGVTALWLLPFYPSPLRDDGYDIADYEAVHPAYGTLRDAENFIREAHARGLRVITELVCNHTADQHPWFQRARHSKPGSVWRDFYVWSDTPDRYPEARIIFQDFEKSNWTWDPVAGAYFWHRFYSHQPDLNFDNPKVRAAITHVLDFWLDRGVDGVRLDAVPYLFERDGTDGENLPETHAFLRELRRHVDEKYGDRMLLAEANQWPEDAVAYFGNGDECHMAFNFPVMPRLFMAIRMEERLPIVDIVEQTPPVPNGAQWALFLRNHDELTLEMVTDEERDYMYRIYADDIRARVNVGIRRRLAPLLGNHRRRIELMNGLLFSLPGTPFIYYGDEIGMGDNVYLGDRDSVRTPMQWNGDRNAGFSMAERERLYLPVVTSPEHHYEAVNVAVEQANPHSLLWWMKRLIALRERHPAFGRGTLEMLYPENRHILAFVRRSAQEADSNAGDGETILVVANLSRFFQPIELDLASFEGRQPVELFGRVEFPAIGHGPYSLTLGPHEFLWLSLEPARGGEAAGTERPLPTLLMRDWEGLAVGTPEAERVALVLAGWVRARSWYRGAERTIQLAEITDRIVVKDGQGSVAIVLLTISYMQGESETYLVPLTTAHLLYDSLVFGDGSPIRAEPPELRIANLAIDGQAVAYLVDASRDAAFEARLVEAVARKRRLRGDRGELVGRPGRSLPRGLAQGALSTSQVMREGETAGVEVDGADRLVVKLRHILELGDEAVADLERYLTALGADWIPRHMGELEYRAPSGRAGVAALLRFSPARPGDVTAALRASLAGFLEQAAASNEPPERTSLLARDLVAASRREYAGDVDGAWHDGHGPHDEGHLAAHHGGPPHAGYFGSEHRPGAEESTPVFSAYLELARSIGNRVAELHLGLAGVPPPTVPGKRTGRRVTVPPEPDPALAPEPFSRLYQRSIHQSFEASASRTMRLLQSRIPTMRDGAAPEAGELLARRAEIEECLYVLVRQRFAGSRIRTHGALRLDAVIQTERGQVMIDLETETSQPANERRLKRSPLRDVATMLRSIQGLALDRISNAELAALRPQDQAALEAGARRWYFLVASSFLRGYRERMGDSPLLPRDDDHLATLLGVYLVHEALVRMDADLRSGSDRLVGSIRGVLQVLGA